MNEGVLPDEPVDAGQAVTMAAGGLASFIEHAVAVAT